MESKKLETFRTELVALSSLFAEQVANVQLTAKPNEYWCAANEEKYSLKTIDEELKLRTQQSTNNNVIDYLSFALFHTLNLFSMGKQKQCTLDSGLEIFGY